MATYIGLDVGGTKAAGAVIRNGQIEKEMRVPTSQDSGEALIDQLVDLVEHLRTDDVCAVGAGIPSAVEFATGRIQASVNVPLHDVPLRQVMTERIGIPVYIDNDANCAAFAEAFDDQGRLCSSDLVMLTLGTGVGGGLVLNGRPYRGITGAAAELGHVLVGLDLEDGASNEPGTFPRKGSLECAAAGRAFDKFAIQVAERHPESFLGQMVADGHTIAGYELVQAAHSGDKPAREAVRILGERLGIGIANMINTFDPGEVVIGGGASAAGDLLLAPARKVAKAYTVPGCGTKTVIRIARHGVRAGLLGAALMAQDQIEKGEAGTVAPIDEAEEAVS